MGITNEVIIDVNDVYKNFRVYYDKGAMLKEQFVNPGRSRYEEREILKGISFKVYRGETVALIGQNGCGKSTTLKMITKILYPNKGTVTVNGKVSSLIELGAGFHPDMSGRENIYINASILGIKKDVVEKRIDEIIRFSELEEFIDNPIRTYSSGMYMRLAFSVAINVDADILLIDEILAVGDQAFQEKCIRKLDELRASGVTVVIVSHAMDQIKSIADRCIWIENGKIVMDGETAAVCDAYENAMIRRREERDEIEEEQRKEAEAENAGEIGAMTAEAAGSETAEGASLEELDTEAIKAKKKNEKALLKAMHKQEKEARQKAFSARWQGGGTQGKTVAGVISLTLIMLLTACISVFHVGDVETEVSFVTGFIGKICYIAGSIGIPMLFILLGFELLNRDFSSRERIADYYKKVFLPAFIIWEIGVAFYQVFFFLFYGRQFNIGTWVKEAFLIKYVDLGHTWTARFFMLLFLFAPVVAKVLQAFSASSLRLILIILWVFLFMFPGFDLYGQANSGVSSFPFYSGTVCYFFYFCVGHMISRYSQRILKGSSEVVLFLLSLALTIFSQFFLEIKGVDYLVKPTYFSVSIMAIMGFDLLIRVKIDEMFPKMASFFETAFAGLAGVYLIFRPIQLLIERYLIFGKIVNGVDNLGAMIAGTILSWLLACAVSYGVMVAVKKVRK